MGFPSPAMDYVEDRLSLDMICVTKPSATYFMKSGAGSVKAGILPDALLVVDSSRRAVDGSLVVASVDGEFRMCMLSIGAYPSLKDIDTQRVLKRLGEDEWGDEEVIFGVITYAVNNVTTFEFHDDVPM